jgi:ribosomal protein S18 acetylase RimI-like enzyme
MMPTKQRDLPDFQVRRLGTGDLDLAFRAIRTLKMPQSQVAFGDEYVRKLLSRPENILIVAAQESVPIGFLLAYQLDRIDRDQGMICLYEIDVSEHHRRQGVGRAMIETLKMICRQENAVKMWVITNRSNLAAFRLYESTGATADATGDQVTFVYKPEN